MDTISICLRGLIIIIIIKATEHTSASYQLIFNPTGMSWIGAATWCQLKSGTLVTVDSQSVVLMIEWYKNHEWSTHWSNDVWAGLYSYNSATGYWQGTCETLHYTYWDAAASFSPTTPCMYMASSDLYWHYDSCTTLHYVVCQAQSGNCSFDDQNMKIDNSFSPLDDITTATLDDCKTSCDNYRDGQIQCWAIMYHAASEKCSMYVSVNPAQYLSTTSNSNANVFYSTRTCFQASILQESEPTSTSNIESEIGDCIITTTDVSTTPVQISTVLSTDSTSDSVSSSTFSVESSSDVTYPSSTIINMNTSSYSTSTPISNTVSSIASTSTQISGKESSSDSTSTKTSDTVSSIASTSTPISDTASSVASTSTPISDTVSSIASTSIAKSNTESTSDSTFSTTITNTESSSDSTSSSTLSDTVSSTESTFSKALTNTDPSSGSTSSATINTESTSDSMSTELLSDSTFSTTLINTETYSDSTSSIFSQNTASTGGSTSTQQQNSASAAPLTTLSTSFSTITSNSSTVNNTTTSCSYECPCGFGSGNVTAEMLQERIAELKAILQIDKTATSSYLRTKTSAEDNRPSSKAVGSIGALFIIFIIGFIVATDFISFFRFVRNFNWKNIKELIVCRR